MPLLLSPRLLPGDWEAWQQNSARDLSIAGTAAFARRVEDAEQRLYRWGRRRNCYIGVSWGKDSVVVADMAARYLPDKPLVWLREEPTYNPDCLRVRDEFLRLYPEARYDEIVVQCRIDEAGTPHATGTMELGFAIADGRYSDGHISGIRADESGSRKRYFRIFDGMTERTLAPIIRWSGDDVFAYLADRNLPIHPVYAMSLGGAMDRERLRVASLRGKRGTEFGRREWEDTYYPDYRHWD